jgi:WS/DGAT/MGAT family acyltransferase
MLDRERPLWKVVLCHGAANGNTVLIWQIHHAMVDGISSVELLSVAHDLKAKAEAPPTVDIQWQPHPLPNRLTQVHHAVRERLTENIQWWTDEAFGLLDAAHVKKRLQQTTRTAVSLLPTLWSSAPRVPFNGQLSGQRQFAWAEFSFAEIRSIRSLLGGTVNDVVLAVIAGGLGRYLRAHEVSTKGMELRALCPVSMRREDERGALGNRVSVMIAPLYVDISDPVQRLIAERTAMEQLKEHDQAGVFFTITDFGSRLSPFLQAAAGQFPLPNFLFNTVSTNIPGPQIPLYLNGHKLLAWCPLGITAANIGLFNAILSYNQKLTISATVDPQLLPDPWFYTDCLQKSFVELLAAAERSAATRPSTPPPDPTPQQPKERRKKARERAKAA